MKNSLGIFRSAMSPPSLPHSSSSTNTSLLPTPQCESASSRPIIDLATAHPLYSYREPLWRWLDRMFRSRRSWFSLWSRRQCDCTFQSQFCNHHYKLAPLFFQLYKTTSHIFKASATHFDDTDYNTPDKPMMLLMIPILMYNPLRLEVSKCPDF